MSKRIAVILSGCGVYDGSEIHEATLSFAGSGPAGSKSAVFCARYGANACD